MAKLKIIVIFILFFNSLTVFAEGEPWRIVSNLQIQKDKWGFSVLEGENIQDKGEFSYFEMNVDKEIVTEISKEKFLLDFSLSEKLLTDPKYNFNGIGDKIKLQDGRVIEVKSVCEEGADEMSICIGKSLKFEGKEIPLNLKYGMPFEAKKIDGNIWFAVGQQGEYEPYGYGAFALEEKTGKIIFKSKDDNVLINEFLKDSFHDNILTTSNKGIRVIDLKLGQTIKKYYFHRDFNPKTKLPELYISHEEKMDNWLASVANRLGFAKDPKFYENAKSYLKEEVDNFDRWKYESKEDGLKFLIPFLYKGLISNVEKEACYATDLLSYFYKGKELPKLLLNVLINKESHFCTDRILEYYDAYKRDKVYTNEQTKKADSIYPKK